MPAYIQATVEGTGSSYGLATPEKRNRIPFYDSELQVFGRLVIECFDDDKSTNISIEYGIDTENGRLLNYFDASEHVVAEDDTFGHEEMAVYTSNTPDGRAVDIRVLHLLVQSPN